MGYSQGFSSAPSKAQSGLPNSKEEAERQYYDPASIRRQLEDVAQARKTTESPLRKPLVWKLNSSNDCSRHQRDSE